MHYHKKKHTKKIWVGTFPLVFFTAACIYVLASLGITKHTIMDAAVRTVQASLGYQTVKSCMPVLTYDATQSAEKTIYEYLAKNMDALLPIYGYARQQDTQLSMNEGAFFQDAGEQSCGNNIDALTEALILQENRSEEDDSPKDTVPANEQIKASQEPASDGKTVKYSRAKLNDFDYLIQNFYRVDSTTTTNQNQLNASKMLAKDMRMNKNETQAGPQILIYHTHSQERFSDSKDQSQSVVGLGDYLTQLLEGYGYQVLHHKGEYDLPDRDTAYSRAAPALEKLLQENPSIEVMIDLHRDGVEEGTRLVKEIDGKQTATIMFFNGLSHTTAQGDISYLYNPNLEDNLAFSFQMQLAASEKYPGFSRCIYLRGYRYNLHYLPKSALIEVGAQTNTYEEVQNAMKPLADILHQVLSGKVK